MEHISNKEKAREICGCGNCYHNLKGSECLKDNGILCCLKPCLKNTLQAMQWKDKQFAQEKQKLIDEACKLMQQWILEHDYIDIMELEDYIKQKMEES